MAAILFIILFLIFINALYVAAEFSAVGVRQTQIKPLADQGNYLAKTFYPTLNDPKSLDRYIAACQVGITLSSLLLGAYAQFTLSGPLASLILKVSESSSLEAYSAASVIILIGLTIAQVIAGELIPKSIALQFPVRVALFTVLPMKWSLVFLGPFITFLNGSGNLMLRFIGIKEPSHGHVHSPQEIAMLIAESHEGGLLEEEDQMRLNQALSLSLKSAHQIMVPRAEIQAIDVSQPAEEVIRTLVASPFSRLPVYRESIDKIVGIIRTKDFVAKYSQSEGEIPAIDDLITPATFIPDTISADRILAVLREQGAHQALVVDEHGAIEGLVTLEDVLAELFGEVADEFKGSIESEVERISETELIVSGKLRIDKLAFLTGSQWESEADTVSGLIVEELEAFPNGGEKLQIDGWDIEVLGVQNHVVTKASFIKRPTLEDKAPGEEEEK